MKKYKLTFWQRLSLIPIWLFWFTADKSERKSWHEVKKGMENHKCNFVKPFYEQGYKFMACNHEGCNMCEPVDLI